MMNKVGLWFFLTGFFDEPDRPNVEIVGETQDICKARKIHFLLGELEDAISGENDGTIVRIHEKLEELDVIILQEPLAAPEYQPKFHRGAMIVGKSVEIQ